MRVKTPPLQWVLRQYRENKGVDENERSRVHIYVCTRVCKCDNFLLFATRRLTPLMAYWIIFLLGIYKFLGAGPRWNDVVEYANDDCEAYWWTNLLYINNLYPVENHVSEK